MIIPTPTTSLLAEFAAEVRRDLALAPKQLQSKYLYDALGSSLFEAICRLPWYRITRAESALLTRHAAEVVSALGDEDRGTLVELGCGSGEKLVVLAEALQAAGGSARVHLIDISSQALEQTE
ncbi:MAG TPA: L-histidine N(alpha)-methyltransferase, partial [Vicinamibacterales bacterium]|nr:L-histidine N(alpha)-methyltransferase [Vicinamibacterales bacterium]